MGQLTSSTKTYRGVDVPSNVILDKDETTVAFPEDATTSSKFHRGKNLHHIIFANPSDSTKIYVDYSLNGEHFFTVFTTATNGDNLYWDTGAHVPPPLLGTTALGAGGGVNACPPVLVRLRVGSGDFSVLNVRTYGTVVR